MTFGRAVAPAFEGDPRSSGGQSRNGW